MPPWLSVTPWGLPRDRPHVARFGTVNIGVLEHFRRLWQTISSKPEPWAPVSAPNAQRPLRLRTSGRSSWRAPKSTPSKFPIEPTPRLAPNPGHQLRDVRLPSFTAEMPQIDRQLLGGCPEARERDPAVVVRVRVVDAVLPVAYIGFMTHTWTIPLLRTRTLWGHLQWGPSRAWPKNAGQVPKRGRPRCHRPLLPRRVPNFEAPNRSNQALPRLLGTLKFDSAVPVTPVSISFRALCPIPAIFRASPSGLWACASDHMVDRQVTNN